MWVFAKGIGFISIVQSDIKNDDDLMCVRARERQHLVNAFPAQDDQIIETRDGDYRYRVMVQRDVVMDLLAECVADVDYTTNVKGEVSGDDDGLHDAMMRCWSALVDYQYRDDPDEEDEPAWHPDDDDDGTMKAVTSATGVLTALVEALPVIDDDLEAELRDEEDREFDRRLQFQRLFAEAMDDVDRRAFPAELRRDR